MRNETLIEARKAKKLTQAELAENVGCAKSTVSSWENGYSNPTLEDAFKIARILGKDVGQLFSRHKVQESCTRCAT